MKKYVFALVALIICICTFIYLLRPSSFSSPKSESSKTKNENRKSKTLAEQVADFPGLTKAIIPNTDSSAECRNALEAIQTESLSQLSEELKSGKLRFGSHCVSSEFKNIVALKNFPETCHVPSGAEIPVDCTIKMLLFKSILIHQATKNDNISALSKEILVYKFLGQISDGSLESVEGRRSIRDLGKALYDRIPDSESAAKAAAVGYLTEDTLNESDQADFDQFMEEVRPKFPENWELYEIDLVRTRNHSEAEFVKRVNDYYQNHPDSAIAIYYMGCLKWTNNDANGSRQLFQEAVNRNPSDTRFKETLENSAKMAPPEKVCSIRLNFNPESF